MLHDFARILATTLLTALLTTLFVVSEAFAVCPASVSILDELTCSSAISGQVTGADPSDLGGNCFGFDCYTCGDPYNLLTQTAGEDVYSFECQADGPVTMDVTGMDCDLDIYILDDSCDPFFGCEEGSTRASSLNDSLTFDCVSGETYYIVVEAYGYTEASTYSGFCGPGEGNYTLEFDVSAGTGCPEDCANDEDDDLDGDLDCDDDDCAEDPVCCDADEDGYASTEGSCGGDDCDDSNPDINPGADEWCDGVDDDCDGDVDEDALDADTWYDDGDSDGYGDASDTEEACDQPSGAVADATDCDDTDGDVFPGADEYCNSTDDDCDSDVDEDAVDARVYYDDGDSDGFGDPGDSLDDCSAPSGHVSNDDDCDDTDFDINPDADEVCNGDDDDCDSAVDEDATDWSTWYDDGDSDGYGDPADSVEACDQPSGAVADATDCDDANRLIYPGADETCNSLDDDCDSTVDEDATDFATYYDDGDSDGFGDASDSTEACSAPSGHVSDSSDCDDTDGAVFPGADETCNSTDDDCDSDVDEDATDARVYYDDGDSDGFGDAADTIEDCSTPSGYTSDSSDCDDTDGDVFPGADELCNSNDDDCDALIDEDATDVATWYHDADSDGYGDPGDAEDACEAPADHVSDATDCHDANRLIYPGADETCNSLDDDCDSTVDEDATDFVTYYHDDDSDGFGDASDTVEDCSTPSGYTSDSTDCDDADGAVFPGADETCNATDDDCDSTVDEDATDAASWYDDSDEDGYGDAAVITAACEQPDGAVSDDQDCDDGDAAVYPGADETCNETDDDCDLSVDEDAIDAAVWYDDDDEDSYGDPKTGEAACEQPDGAVSDATDCDDTDDTLTPADVDADGQSSCDGDCDDSDSDIYVGAEETPYDGIDQDCDGSDWTDVDGDGYDAEIVGGSDCNDLDEDVNPGVYETADGVNEDCDSLVDEGTEWYDDDGDGYAEDGGDCDDDDFDVNPGIEAEAECDEVDEDCDDIVDEGTDCYDDDGDGWTEDDGDCNDDDPATSPDATEIMDNGFDDDCDGIVDAGLYDGDGDGYAPAGGDCDDSDAGAHPGAEELADGADQDCDDIIDEGTDAYDDDGDGWTEDDGDCDDADDEVAPENPETPDGIDEDCDEVVDEGTDRADDDGDGYSELGGDCDDEDPDLHPGADEAANGHDDDCDEAVDEGTGDLDNDGWSIGDGDCDDEDGWVNPSVTEMCDDVDNDCDLAIDEGCVELDETGLDKGECGCGLSNRGTGPAGLLWFLPLLGLAVRRRMAS